METTMRYQLKTYQIDNVTQEFSFDVFVYDRNVGRITCGVFYPAHNEHAFTIPMMEWLIREYRELTK